MLAQQEVAFAAARRQINRQLDVVVDEPRDDSCVGRHAGQDPEVDPVCILRGEQRPPGETLSVRVVDAQEYDLVVEPLQQKLPLLKGGRRP